MLAVQRPSMGSSKPPNQNDMPFGYSFDGADSGFPFQSPPAPAPGPSLLDDHESKLLDSFFDGVSSDHFTGDFYSAAGDGMDNMGFGWQDIPPAFMGTSSSFGQQPLPLETDALHGMTYPDMNGHGRNQSGLQSSTSHTPTTSADVLAAAALLQNGQNGRSHSMDHVPSLFSVPSQSRSMSTSLMPSYNQQHPRSLSHKQDDYSRETMLAEMVFGASANHGRQAHKDPLNSVDIRWGSDASFGTGQAFIPPVGQETVEALEQNKMSSLECFEPHSSTAASTRPSSPVVTRLPDSSRRQSNVAAPSNEEEVAGEESRPRKRRKNKIKEEEVMEEEDENETNSKAARNRRRPKSMAAATTTTATESPQPSKRRKSAVSSSTKPSRENLTEDQKRENHIKSEQKRRTLIKEGFEDLGQLVPDLRSGGFSKSAILVMTGDFLEDLIKGNQVLKARLDGMDGR